MGHRPPGLLFIAACVAALALRLLLPAGFMPAGDGFALSICSASATQADRPLTGDTGPDVGTSCDFALAGTPMLLAVAALLLLPLLPLLPALLPRPALPAARRLRAWPPSRGPPCL